MPLRIGEEHVIQLLQEFVADNIVFVVSFRLRSELIVTTSTKFCETDSCILGMRMKQTTDVLKITGGKPLKVMSKLQAQKMP